MTLSYYEDVVNIWDTATGKIVKSYTLNDDCYNAALSPDGKTLVLQTKKEELTVQPIAGGKATTLEVGKHGPGRALFTCDGKHLIVMSSGFASLTSHDYDTELALYAVEKDYACVARRVVVGPGCSAMTASPNGRYLALAGSQGRVWVVDLETLDNPRRPDSKVVALAVLHYYLSLRQFPPAPGV